MSPKVIFWGRAAKPPTRHGFPPADLKSGAAGGKDLRAERPFVPRSNIRLVMHETGHVSAVHLGRRAHEG